MQMSSHAIKKLLLAPLLTGLLLTGCVSASKYDALDDQYNELNASLSSEIASNQLQITRLQGAIKVSVNSQLLFPSGGWMMPPRAQATIAKMAPILAPQVREHINVNGYTDNTPIGPELSRQGIPTNVALSDKRANTVMQYLIAQGINPSMLSAQGFGDTNPIASNDTPQGKLQNRRVELTLTNPNS